jgi:hypothetical protein
MLNGDRFEGRRVVELAHELSQIQRLERASASHRHRHWRAGMSVEVAVS